MAFVKFSRGLQSQYDALPIDRRDSDTLYLVYESTSSETGSLYLGNKLISSVGTGAISLSNLTNVSIPDTENLDDGMLLQYNAQSQKWEAVPLSEVGVEPTGSGISIVDNLDNITDPEENDIAIQGTELFIYDGSQWKPLTVSDLEDRVSKLENQVGEKADTASGQVATGLYKELENLRSDLQADIISKIADAQHLTYKVVESIDDIDVLDESNSNIVFLVKKPSTDIEDENEYDEYFVVNNSLEKIGSWGANLSGYVKNGDDRLLTEEQKEKLDSLGLENGLATISANQVGNLAEFIHDNQYIKDVQAGVFNVDTNGVLNLVSVPSTALTNYISVPTFNNTVGDLTQLTNRVSGNSTLVDEINTIKASVIWQELTQ